MAEVRVCPFLPPIPSMNPLTHEVTGFRYQVCLADHCKLYPVCSALIKEATGSETGSTGFLTGLKAAFKPGEPTA